MLFEMAIADAYAIAFEFVPDSPDRPNNLTAYWQHPTYAEMMPGSYTDDTQRALANATLVLDWKTANEDQADNAYRALFDPIAYVERYQAVFSRDPRPGYSRRFDAFLRENLNTDPVEFALRLNRKPTNGAVMGAATLGFLPDLRAVKLAASAQALATHSYAAVPFAQIVAMAAFYTINRIGPLSELTNWLEDELAEQGKNVREFLSAAKEGQNVPDKVGMGASSAVALMLYHLPRQNSLAELARIAVEVGGDTDSAAAIMVAVASESDAYRNDFPDVLQDGLEDGVYGKEALKRYDQALRNREPKA